MWQEQETTGERRERRKGMLPDRHIPWALGEQPFDCHLATDGALSEVWVIQEESFDRSMGAGLFQTIGNSSYDLKTLRGDAQLAEMKFMLNIPLARESVR